MFKTGPVGLGYYLDKPWVNRKLGELSARANTAAGAEQQRLCGGLGLCLPCSWHVHYMQLPWDTASCMELREPCICLCR